MIELVIGITEWLAWSKRHKDLREIVREVIEEEGGELECITIIGFLIRSPFPPINIRPVYMKAICRYPKDTGAWLICDSDGFGTHWVWRSDTRAEEPPIERPYPVKVDNSVIALSPWVSKLLCLVFFLGVIGLVIGLCAYA
jgi:hypothetical protein